MGIKSAVVPEMLTNGFAFGNFWFFRECAVPDPPVVGTLISKICERFQPGNQQGRMNPIETGNGFFILGVSQVFVDNGPVSHCQNFCEHPDGGGFWRMICLIIMFAKSILLKVLFIAFLRPANPASTFKGNSIHEFFVVIAVNKQRFIHIPVGTMGQAHEIRDGGANGHLNPLHRIHDKESQSTIKDIDLKHLVKCGLSKECMLRISGNLEGNKVTGETKIANKSKIMACPGLILKN